MIMIIIIQFQLSLFTRRVNSYKANYRNSTKHILVYDDDDDDDDDDDNNNNNNNNNNNAVSIRESGHLLPTPASFMQYSLHRSFPIP
jgi:hypothetical protein